MKKLAKNCAALMLFFTMGCGVSSAAGLIGGEILEYGYYQKEGEFKRYQNIATTTGYVQEGKAVELVKQTDRIPLTKHRLFGFKFRITGFDDKNVVQLKLVVTHPEITRSNGSKSTGYSYPVMLDVTDGVIENRSGYSIDHDFEMVEGEWKFELWYYKQKLVSQTFHTVAAEGGGANQESDLRESGTPENPQQDQSGSAATSG